MSYPVSVCMIAKNEEKYIQECLEHLKPYDMEIIVVDTGSTDRTKEIARKYTDKIYDFAWIHDFSAARNFCAKKATNDWILVIDCDEYIEKLDWNLLSAHMKKQPKSAGKIRIRNIARRNNGEVTCVDEEITRFYHRGFYHFAYPVHENVVPIKETTGKETSISVPIEVIHHGYNIDAEAMKAKQERNLKLLYKALENTNTRNAYTYFQIGQSEQVLGNYNRAIESYHKCLEQKEDSNLQYMNTCVVQLATAYAQIDEPQKAVEIMEAYRGKWKNARFVYAYALSLLGVEEFLKALMQFVVVSTLPDRESLGDDLGYCYQCIIKLYTMFGEKQMASDFQRRYEEYQKEKGTL